MKARQGIGFPLRVVLLLDLLVLLSIPALWLTMESSWTAKARYGVELPELAYEATDYTICEVRFVRVVLHPDGSTRMRGRSLKGDALVEEIFSYAHVSPERTYLTLVADRNVSYQRVVGLLQIARTPPLEIPSLEVLFRPAGRWVGSDSLYFRMTGAPEVSRCTVRAPPETPWGQVLAAIVAKLTDGDDFAELLLSEEAPATGLIEVSMSQARK